MSKSNNKAAAETSNAAPNPSKTSMVGIVPRCLLELNVRLHKILLDKYIISKKIWNAILSKNFIMLGIKIIVKTFMRGFLVSHLLPALLFTEKFKQNA